MRAGLAFRLALLLALPALPAAACMVDPYSYTPFRDSLALDLSGRGFIARAWYDGPSEIYDHRALGRAAEPTRLFVQMVPVGLTSDCGSIQDAGDGHVFEDLAPRLADLNGDRENEIITVRSDIAKGAQLAVYGVSGDSFGLIASTPYLGHHRWLAPAGIADFDGDGRPEIAVIEMPHLKGDLVFYALTGAGLTETARLAGFTNHRFGTDEIIGGLRDCGTGPELVLASKDWSRLMIVGWDNGPKGRDEGAFSKSALRAALDCR